MEPPPPRRGKIIDLDEIASRAILWVRRSEEEEPFEVSKIVDGPLLSRCPTAPRCVGESSCCQDEEASDADDEACLCEYPQMPSDRCPYSFADRGECITARNQSAMAQAMFTAREVRLVTNYLASLGYLVECELVPPWLNDGNRLLLAHSSLGSQAEFEILPNPLGCDLILVRQCQIWSSP